MKSKGRFSDIIHQAPLVLVDFYTEWCGPCKVQSPILADLKNAVGSQLRIIKVDAEKNTSVSGQFRISGVPTLILFKKGEVVWRQSGVVPLNFLIELVNKYLKLI